MFTSKQFRIVRFFGRYSFNAKMEKIGSFNSSFLGHFNLSATPCRLLQSHLLRLIHRFNDVQRSSGKLTGHRKSVKIVPRKLNHFAHSQVDGPSIRHRCVRSFLLFVIIILLIHRIEFCGFAFNLFMCVGIVYNWKLYI